MCSNPMRCNKVEPLAASSMFRLAVRTALADPTTRDEPGTSIEANQP
jgi:hypothetical protein